MQRDKSSQTEMSDGPEQIRVLCDDPLDGPQNMARDEALLTRVGSGDSRPTLRLYRWNPTTISLGYFQRFADYDMLEPPAGQLDVVRRLTGGGAILHDRELTYSLTLPLGHALLSDGPRKLYDLVHRAIADALKPLRVSARPCGESDDSGPRRGPFFCFERRHAADLLIGREKVAGSAQRRTRNALLQHGSIVLGRRFDQHGSATVSTVPEEAVKHLSIAIPQAFSRRCGLTFVKGIWSRSELLSAEALRGKYASVEWTRRT